MPGPGVPQMPTFNVPAPDWNALVQRTQNPITQAIQGFEDYQKSKQANQLFNLQAQQTQANIRHDDAQSQLEQSNAVTVQQKQALEMYNTFGKTAVVNPELAKSPQWQQRMAQIAQMSGMPNPVGPDGTFDADQFKPDMTDKDIALANEMHPGPQKTHFLNQFRHVDPSMFTQAPDYTGKEVAALTRDTELGIHYQNQDAVAKSRASHAWLVDQWRHELDPYKKQELQARINRENASAAQSYASANRQQTQARMISAEITAGIPQLQANLLKYRANPTLAGPIAKDYTRLTGLAERARIAMEGADAAYEQARSDGADDDTLQKYAAQRAKNVQAYQQAVAMLQQVYTTMQSLPGQSNTLRTGMGAKSVQLGGGANIPPPPSATLDAPHQNPATSGAVQSDHDKPLYINTNNLPKGTKTGVYTDGKTYYITPDGGYYDMDGERVPTINQ